MPGNFFDGQFFGADFFSGEAPRGNAGGGGMLGGPPVERGRREISRDRERFGIRDKYALEVIAEVAQRQVAKIQEDPQKRFDELRGELKLRRIEFRSEYLEELNALRQRLIDAEIARLLRLKEERDILALLMLAAGATI